MLDKDQCDRMCSLIEKLTTNGRKDLDCELFTKLYCYCENSDYLKFALAKIFTSLEKKHAEIRLGAFLIIEEMFERSSYVRELILDDFNKIIELTLESDPKKKLPPPLAAAQMLKQRVLQAIHKWKEKHSHRHFRINAPYNYIKAVMKVDFNDSLKRTQMEIMKENAKREKELAKIKLKTNEVRCEIDANQDEISRVVSEMSNCLSLLIPKPEDLFKESGDNLECEESDDEDLDLREHGLYGPCQTVSIQLSKIQDGKIVVEKTADNEAIIETLKDSYSLAKNKYLPIVLKWNRIVSKEEDSSLFKSVSEMKDLLLKEIQDFEKLKIEGLSFKSLNFSGSEEVETSDSDFEEVEDGKGGYESDVVAPPVPIKNTSSNDPPLSLISYEPVPGPSKSISCEKSIKVEDESKLYLNESRKSKLLKVAPKVPYDVDLLNWEDRDYKPPTIQFVESDTHRFWQPQDRQGEIIELPHLDGYRTRKIEFAGKFEPVKWTCRAPMSNGKLCPRMDREKCPFHGKIVGRDEAGNPTNPKDIADIEAKKLKEEEEGIPEWQDPKLLKELKAQIGIDLTVRKGKRGKKKKTFSEIYPNLTDISQPPPDPRTRIGKKIFKKKTMKRIGEELDRASHKKLNDKFGDQFNYQ